VIHPQAAGGQTSLTASHPSLPRRDSPLDQPVFPSPWYRPPLRRSHPPGARPDDLHSSSFAPPSTGLRLHRGPRTAVRHQAPASARRWRPLSACPPPTWGPLHPALPSSLQSLPGAPGVRSPPSQTALSVLHCTR
jgi:hypothetical protein